MGGGIRAKSVRIDLLWSSRCFSRSGGHLGGERTGKLGVRGA